MRDAKKPLKEKGKGSNRQSFGSYMKNNWQLDVMLLRRCYLRHTFEIPALLMCRGA